MQAVAEQQISSIQKNNVDFHQIAEDYITDCLGPLFFVSPNGQQSPDRWWSLVLAKLDENVRPIGVGRVQVDPLTQSAITLTDCELQIIQQKLAIAQAQTNGLLPVDGAGFVLSEYARKQASRYLQEQITMYYGAVDPVLVMDEPPLWQVTIQFKMIDVGPFTLGTMDVDALTGEVLPLTDSKIARIRERTRGIIWVQAPETTSQI